ncbi:MAG: AAA family ATPase [Prevotella sp.]|nr:AAA family ATPase [Prevotella sp.]MCD8289657.1 AAA family ATPase [Prevotella sp.]
MQNYADYIQQIEIDSLWSGTKHIRWQLQSGVNVLSGVNGVGKSTILNRVIRAIGKDGALPDYEATGVRLDCSPDGANAIRYDVIRSFDRPLINSDVLAKMNLTLATELDWQLYTLQRRFLDYQVNIGNRIIEELQSGNIDAAAKAQQISSQKKLFHDLIDHFFADTKKTVIRSENEIRLMQLGEVLLPHQLSSGEKQLLVIMLTVLVEDMQPCTLFMDEPEVSLHVEWQQQLIDTILQLNPNVQIILTTHSPAVIMNGWMDRVTEVSDIEVNS